MGDIWNLPFLETALQSLEKAVPVVPRAYKGRLIAEICCCSVLVGLSSLFLVLNRLHAKKLGKNLWLFRLHKESGHQIVVNSLFAFVLLALLAAAGQLAGRCMNWTFYIEGRVPYRRVIGTFMPWVVIFIQAWFFSITNLQATLKARRTVNLKPSRQHSMWHNFLLLGVPALILAIVTPLVVYASFRLDKLLSLTINIKTILRQAIADLQAGKPVDPGTLAILLSISKPLQSLLDELVRIFYGISGCCFLAATGILGINVYSLLLVVILRKHVREARKCTPFHSITFQRAREVSVDIRREPDMPTCDRASVEFRMIAQDLDAGEIAKPFCDRTISLAAQSATGPHSLRSETEIELQRLASDLTYAVPIVILMVIALCATLGYLLRSKVVLTSWAATEAMNDGFCWIWVFFNLLTVIALLCNLLRAWRYGDKLASTLAPSTKEAVTEMRQVVVITLEAPSEDGLPIVKEATL